MKRFFGFFFAAMLVVCSCENMGELDDVKNPSAGGYDDTAIKEAIDNLKNRLETLESDVTSIKSMLEGTVQIKTAVKNEDNVWTITLSDNSVINVYPQAEKVEIPEIPTVPQNLITITEEEGVKYWAMYVDGEAKPVLDAQGNKVPVVTVIPEVEIPEPVAPEFKTEEGVIKVSFDGGNTWIITGYEPDQEEDEEVKDPVISCTCTPVFSGVEVVYDEYGSPLYGIFTLVDGYEITVTFEAEWGFDFSFSNESVYIAAGTVSSEQVSPAFYHDSAEDFILQAPKGWSADVVKGESGEYLQITAPTAEEIASGAAVAMGYVKAIGVLPGGKSISAKMEVTTEYMTEISINTRTATVYTEYHRTYQDYLYCGVAPAENFDIKAYADTLSGMFDGMNNPPVGCIDLQQIAFMEIDMNLIYGTEIPVGAHMVFWVIPVSEVRDGWDYIMTVNADNAIFKEFALTSVNVETVATAWNKVDVKAEILGMGNIIYGVTDALYFDRDEFVENQLPYINTDSNASAEMPISYEGSISFFANNSYMLTDINPGRKYVLWMVVEKEGTYTADDLMVWEYETEDLIEGGTIKPTIDTVKVDYTSLKAEISVPEGGALTYYAWVNTLEDLPAYPTDALKMEYLKTNGYISDNSFISANNTDLKQGEDWTLLAVTVDEEGQYGPVVAESYVTKKLSFAAERLTLTLSPEVVTVADTAKITIAHPDASKVTRYLYYAGTTDATLWTNSRYYGGTKETAQNFIALNAYGTYSYNISKLTAGNVINVTGLIPSKEYVVLVMAEHADGSFTEAAVINFTPTMSLGNFVRRDADGDGNDDEAWTSVAPKAAKKTEDWNGDFCYLQMTVEVPVGMTGYAMIVHPDYFKYEGMTTPEQIAEYLFVEGRKCKSNYTTTVTEHAASTGYGVMITWCDADGNFYEPIFVDANISGGFGV